MGLLTLDELKVEMRSYMANRTDLNDRLEIFLTLAQMRMVRAHQFEEFQVTAALAFPFANDDTDAFLSIDSTIYKLWSIRILKDSAGTKLSGANKLEFVPPRRWDDKVVHPDFFARNQPRVYTRWGGPEGQLEVAPMPDQAYTGTWRGLKRPTSFIGASSSQKSDLYEKDDLLIALAVTIALDSLDMEDRARAMWTRYRFMLSEAIDEDDTHPDGDIKPSFETMGRFVEPAYWRDPFVHSVHSDWD